MTSAIYIFWSRVLIVLAWLTFVVLCAGVAVAQDAAPAVAVADEGWGPTMAVIVSSAQAGLLAVITAIGTLLAPHIPAWAKAVVDALMTSEAAKWEDYTKAAVTDAATYAGKMVKKGADRSDFLAHVLHYLQIHNADIVAYLMEKFDRNHNGVLDVLEMKLSTMGLAPEPSPAKPMAVAAKGRVQ